MMLLLGNPIARSGKGKRLWKYWIDVLEDRKNEFDFVETSSGDDVIQLSEKSNETIVALGGDGTINNVINGILKRSTKIRSDKTMGVLYSGTSPDFCKFHSIPIEPELAINTLLKNRRKDIDVVQTEFIEKGIQVTKYFGCSSNIGVGADVAKFANKYRRIFGDNLGTGLGVLRSIFQRKVFKSVIDIDGEEYMFNKTNHIIILKNPHIASELKVKLNLKPDDGKMYIIVINDKSIFQMLRVLYQFYTGDIVNNDSILIKECKEVNVKTTPTIEIEFDGDPQGYTEANFKLLNKTLSLIC